MQTQKEKDKEGFCFTYSAKEQEELKKIREKYVPQEETKMDQLRRLDARVTQTASASAIACGVLGALVLGLGMSLAMTQLGEQLGFMGSFSMVLGIVVGIIGLVFIGAAYPVFLHVLKKERKKAAPEILKLTEELMK